MKVVAYALLSFATLNFFSALAIRSELSKGARFEEINGTSVAYRFYEPSGLSVVGESARPPTGGNPVVFLHGFGGASTDWFYVVEEVSRYAPCLLIDIPPFGLSGKSFGFDYSDRSLVETIIKLLERKGIYKFSLVGHSMGGYLSILIASTFPERVEKLVLVSAAYGTDDEQDERVNAPQTFRRDGDRINPSLVALLDVGLRVYPVLRLVYEGFDPSPTSRMSRQVEYLFAQNYFLPARVLFKFAEDKLRQEPYKHDLASVAAPTLIVYGENDRVTPPAIGDFLSQRILRSRLLLIPGEGHLPLFNERLRSAIVDFLFGQRNFNAD